MYSKGQRITATVEAIYPFGVFVRLADGQRAYIRRRELTLAGDVSLDTAVQVGEQLEALIVEPGGSAGSMELSVRAALPDPWNDFVRSTRPNSVVSATVRSLGPHGVFAEIIPGVQGFVPFEELFLWPTTQRVDDVVWQGDHLEAVVMRLDMVNRRATLSVRRRLQEVTQVEAAVAHLYQKELAKTEIQDKTAMPETTVAEQEFYGAQLGRILLIEDDQAVQIAFAKWLTGLGCALDVAKDAGEALEFCQNQHYDIIFVDIDLPRVDGVAFVHERRGAGDEAIIAMMSGPEVIALRFAEFQALGVAAVFAKPLHRDELTRFLIQVAQSETPQLATPPTDTATVGAVEAYRGIAAFMQPSQVLGKRLQDGLEALVRDTQADASMVFHIESVSRQISLVAHVGQMEFDEEALYGLIESPVKDVIEDQRPLWENHILDQRSAQFRKLLVLFPFESCIGIPLPAGGLCRDALFLFRREGNGFGHPQLRDALAAGMAFSAGLERQLLEERIQDASRVFLSGHLAAGFGHEVYNKLTGLSLHIDNLCDDMDKVIRNREPILDNQTEGQGIRQTMTEVQNIARQLRRTVEDFQRLTRADERFETDINQVIRMVAQQLRPQAARAGIAFHLRLADNLPLVYGSDIRLQQVFLNVMLNAVQHMENKPDARLVLRVTTGVETENAGKLIWARVVDTGPGIHRRLWDKIFALGFTTRRSGSGLGLFMARNLVESMQGRLVVEESVLFKGTTFLVTIPAMTAPVVESS